MVVSNNYIPAEELLSFGYLINILAEAHVGSIIRVAELQSVIPRGDMDVLGAAWEDDDITWWENSDTSPGIYWTEHLVDGDFLFAISVYSEDINGDGYMDILGAAWGADDITWWDITQYSPGGELVSSILYLSNDPDWGTIDWSSSTPSGTSVSFLVRASTSQTFFRSTAHSCLLRRMNKEQVIHQTYRGY